MSDEQQPVNQDSIERDRLVDSICVTFEKMYFAGEHPQIETFLERVDGPTKHLLLVELIELEIHIRRLRGETIPIAEYQARFPGLSAARLEATLRTSLDSSPNDHHSNKTPAGELETLDSGNQPSQTGNREFVRYFGDYELLSVIARGGMGVVYKARQISLNRIVALKMILSGEFASKEAVDRFYCEAKAAALLDHPGIVPIFEVGAYQGKHFFSMAYVEGSSLAFKLNDGPLDPTQAALMMMAVAQAVHYAHEKGVIHRDLKPSNILLDLQARPRIADFGLAKSAQDDSGVTVSGQVLGTPSYMPPEQAAGQINTIGPESDVYALGAILYSLTTGRPPFQAASSVETLRQVLEKEPVAPRQINPAIPRDLETIILKCLEKSLPRRYGSANQLADELKRFLDGRPILARPISHVAKLWRLCRRNPAVASLSSFTLLLLAGVAIISGMAYLREAALLVKQEQLTLNESKAKEKEREAKQQETHAKVEAIAAARDAELARAEQEKQALIAQQETEKAKASEALTRRNLYVSNAARIAELIKEQNFNRAQSLLTRHIPTSTDQEDLRGFDWYYNWRQINQELASYDFQKSVEVIDLSADEKTLAVGCEGGRAYLLDLESGKLQDAVFAIDDGHWANLAFVGEDRLFGHGRLGGFKLWNRDTHVTIASLINHLQNLRDSGKSVEYRIPAAVSKNGEQMVCEGSAAILALWDLKPLRPSTFPLINNGTYPKVVSGNWIIDEFYLSPSQLGAFGINVIPPEVEEAVTAGSAKTVDEWYLQRNSDRASREYVLPGVMMSLPQSAKDLQVGHPVSTMSISTDNKFMVSGTKTGELRLWDLKKVEHPAHWTEGLFKTCQISDVPIIGVAISDDGKLCLATDGKSWQALQSDTLQQSLKVEMSHGLCTSVEILKGNRLAIGMSTGVVEVWSLLESKVTRRFTTGQSAVTKIIEGVKSNRIYVSNADGTVCVIPRTGESQAIVPQTSRVAGKYSNSPVAAKWCQSTGCFAYESVYGGLVVVNLYHPQEAVKNTGRNNILPISSGIRFRDRESEIVSFLFADVVISDSETLAEIKTISVKQHKDLDGRVHAVDAYQHPHAGFVFDNGQFTRDSEFAKQPASGVRTQAKNYSIRSADMFSDEKRLAIAAVQNPVDDVHLFHRDIDSDAIISELRIMGIGLSTHSQVTCIDEHRVLISGVNRVNSEDLFALVWNTTDGSLQVVEAEAFAIKGSHQIELIPEHEQLVVWDKLAVHVLQCKTLESAYNADVPEEDYIQLVHVSANGDLFAVLARNPEQFSWAKWDRKTGSWITVFESNQSLYLQGWPKGGNPWFVDANNQILYHMLDLGIFKRWSTASGTYLQPLIVPTGSIESLQVDRSGMVASMLKSALLEKMNPNGVGLLGSINWHQNGKCIRTDAIVRGQSAWLFPLPEPNSWLTGNGVLSVGSPSAGIKFVGGELSPGETDSLATLSDDQSCFVKLQANGLLHRWTPEADPEGGLEHAYRYKGSGPIDKFSKAERTSLSPNGRRIAYSTPELVRWSEQPFQQWHDLVLNIAPGTKVTALRWSTDNAALAVGLSDGDVALHHLPAGRTQRLTRGHEGAIHDLVWMPDRRTLTTAGNDGAIIIWDLQQEEIRLRLVAHHGAVKALAFDAPRNVLYSGGDDGRILPWVAAPIETAVPHPQPKFAPPNPDAAHEETRAAPSAEALHIRKLIAWLQTRGAVYRTASFGILPYSEPSAADVNRFEELSIHTVSLRENQVIVDDDMAQLEGLSELRVLDLANCKLSPLGLAKLKRLTGLHTLVLGGIDLSGFDFENLADSPRIQTLTLNGCSISDEQLVSIIRLFPMLRELELSRARVTSASVSKISALKLLTKLKLDSTYIDDESLAAIGSLSRLEVLDLSGTKLSGSNLDTIAFLKLLKELRLRAIPVTDTAIHALKGLRILRTLDLYDCRVTEEGVRNLLAMRPNIEPIVSPQLFGRYPQLEALLELGPIRGEIDVDGKPLSAWDAIVAIQRGGSITGLAWPVDPRRSSEDLPVLARLPKLERIRVSTDAIPKVHFPLLAKIPGLQSLELNRPPNYLQADIDFIANIQQLQNLKIKYFSDDVLNRLQTLQNLESLLIESSLSLRIDTLSKAFARLRELAWDKVEAKPLADAIPFLASLESLTVRTVPKKDVWPILAQIKTLKYLNISGSTTASNLKLIEAALPGVQVQNKK